MSLVKSIATVGGCTAISRVAGFIRDILIARFLGATMMADAFFVALRFPNLFRSLFAEGTLNVAFVPLFTGELQKGKKEALDFARSVFSFLFYVLLIFTVLIELVMPGLMFILAPGFEQIAGKMALTTTLSRITFPFLLFVSLVSLLAGVLNSLGRFWAAAFTPTLLNLGMIFFLLCITPFINSPYAPAYALSIGVTVAGVIELLFLLWHIWKADFLFGLMGPIKTLGHLSKGVKTLLKKMAPGVLGSGVYQINLFFDTFFVSFVGAGAISWLNYANHLFQLPIGIIGVAIGTALLPILSKHVKAGELEEANIHLNRGLEISLAMSVASFVGLFLLAEPIIETLFQYGKFSADDTIHTAKALRIFAFGLPAYMATKALSPFFYARGDTTTPVKIAVVGVVLNTLLAVILMQFWGYAGIAAATSLTVWINASQYVFRLLKHPEFSVDKIFRYRAPRILLSNFVMWMAIYSLLLVKPEFHDKVLSIFTLLTIISLGGISYIVSLIVTKGMPLAQLKNILKRKFH
ncbi:MAG: murein biosynthesis integral membrane protein MurJ [Alphaproteobacteria bacterium]|nr:murein biosynthesis integral membrane protein MurJ [Alphaproteobacteria bacterium]